VIQGRPTGGSAVGTRRLDDVGTNIADLIARLNELDAIQQHNDVRALVGENDAAVQNESNSVGGLGSNNGFKGVERSHNQVQEI
jgi:hypothetical protein